MALDRDELAARLLVALVRSGRSIGAEADAVSLADALLARLRPSAPVASESPRPEAGRPKWVRITGLPLGDDGRYPFAVGQVCKVLDWWGRSPLVAGFGRNRITLSALGASVDPANPGYATWEPCAAPSPSPAATPAAWVPSVGDVVRVARPPTDDEWECFMDASWTYRHSDEGRVVETDKDHAKHGKVSVVRVDGQFPDDPHGVEACRLVLVERPSERAAAGLPVDESAVDRVALAKAIRNGWIGTTRGISPWDDANPSAYGDWLNAADAAIAFMAKGGAS